MPQLTPSFFKQATGESLKDLPRFARVQENIRFTHILHPYFDRAVALNNAAQALTFETLRIAARFAAPQVSVRHVCVTLPDDRALVPEDCIAAAPLSRTVADLRKFAHPRALPLLFDILDQGITVPEIAPPIEGARDYIILANSDIHLQPHFYQAIGKLINMGYDAIDVTRRTLSHHEPSVAELPFLFSEYGARHPGHDCFVFPRELYGKFAKSESCVGAGGVMQNLIFNLVALTQRFLVLTDAHLTFHIGNDRAWLVPRFKEYTLYNHEQARGVGTELAKDENQVPKLLDFLDVILSSHGFIESVEKAARMKVSFFVRLRRRSRKLGQWLRKVIFFSFRKIRQLFIKPGGCPG